MIPFKICLIGKFVSDPKHSQKLCRMYLGNQESLEKLENMVRDSGLVTGV